MDSDTSHTKSVLLTKYAYISPGITNYYSGQTYCSNTQNLSGLTQKYYCLFTSQSNGQCVCVCVCVYECAQMFWEER